MTGGATGATGWSWTGSNSFTSSSQSPSITNITTAGAGVYSLTASNTCGSATPANTSSVTVYALPTITLGSSPSVCKGVTSASLPYSATTGSPNQYSITYNATAISAGFANVSFTTLPASPITLTVPAAAGAATYNGTITVKNTTTGCSSTATTAFTVTVTLGCPCAWNSSATFTVTHTSTVPASSSIAPATKTITYNQTQTSLSGSSLCWITQNLGATNQATALTDGLEADGGWYWQFNRKVGYQYIASLVPTNWDGTQYDFPGGWIAANDPCTLLLGTPWRLPTGAEWSNVLTNLGGGGLPPATAFASVLLLHEAGMLNGSNGALSGRGSGFTGYWSSTYHSLNGGYDFEIQNPLLYSYDSSNYGEPVRCVR